MLWLKIISTGKALQRNDALTQGLEMLFSLKIIKKGSLLSKANFGGQIIGFSETSLTQTRKISSNFLL